MPITKVDAEKRLVSGVATAENVDKLGEIVDYETAKKFFTNPELWPGNIREMHKPEAVGTAVEVECDDANKVISVTARVSKGAPNTWEKVLDGTLKMFSIGGSGKRVIEKIGDAGKTAKRLFLEQLVEVSLVDNGANPLAKFDIVKMADGQLLVGVADGTVEPFEKAAAALDAVLEDVTKAAGKDDEKNKTASGKEGKEYAGTDGTSFPITDPKDVANAARALGRTDQDKAKVKANIIRIAYKLGATFVAKLPEAWKKKADQKDAEKAVSGVSFEKAVDAETGETIDIVSFRVLNRDGTVAGEGKVEKGGPEPYDIDSALQAISFVNRLMSNEYWEARYAAAGASDGQKAQIAMLKAACDALLAFLQAEYEEQFEPDAANTVIQKAGARHSPGTPALDLSDVLDDDDVVEMFVKSLAVIQKAGARHSAKDQAMVQKIHDVSTTLGAGCPDPEGDEAEKVAKAAAASAECKTCKGTKKIRDGHVACPDCSGTAKAAQLEPDDTVKKIAADLETTKALLTESQATVAKQAETAAALDARLKRIEDQPAGGGPVRNAQAVDKTLGGPDAAGDDSSPEQIVKALQAIAKDSDDPAIREAAARSIVKFGQKTGLARIEFSGR